MSDDTKPGEEAVCIHIARAELEPAVKVTLESCAHFVQVGAKHHVTVCALCFGWFEAVVRFGLPVKR